jgi:hypothetical protein
LGKENMKIPRALFVVLLSAAAIAHATIDYRPRTRKIEITADTGVITILLSNSTPADIGVEARYAGVHYQVPERESQVLKGRAFTNAELRILPYDARQDGAKVESLQIVVHLPVDAQRGQEIYFAFRGDGTFSQTIVMDYDARGMRPAQTSTGKKPNQSSQRNAMTRPFSVFESRASRG